MNIDTYNRIVDFSKIDNNKELLNSIVEQGFCDRVNYVYLGNYSYNETWVLQQEIHKMVFNEELKNIVLFVEHNHVYTFGKNGNTDFLLNSYPKEVDVVYSDRGGQVTYHGPGQLIGYPIINLNHFKKSISWYMNLLEETIISVLKDYGIIASKKDKLIGVWVDDDKICAMGVRLSKWVTMHGFALNICPDFKYYDGIIPCGISNYGVASMNDLLNEEFNTHDIIEKIVENLDKYLNEKI